MTCKQKKKLQFLLTAICLLSFCTKGLIAQVTKISGKIYDTETKESLPFVNILLKGTKSGTTSDIDGIYSISTTEVSDSLIVSYIGYERIAKPVKKFTSQVINVELHKSIVSLQAVEIKAGENPAHRIIKKVIEHKVTNDKEKLDAFQYEAYNKVEFDLNNLSEEFKNKKALKPFRFIFENIDSSDVKQKPFLPLFITESLSDYYYKRSPKFKKEVIKANKLAGVKNESISQFMGDMYQNVNIYDNTILVFGKNFISPISGNGLLYYKYYLIDSMWIDNSWCYQLQFKPRRKQELTFNGNLWIADTSFAVKRLEMSIANDANINFVNALNVVQEYQHIENAWMLSKDKLLLDFTIRKDSIMGIYGRKTTSYKNIIVNQPKEDDFYSHIDNLIVEEGATKKSDEYWKNARHDTLTKNENQIYKMIDTLQTLPAYKTWIDVITIFVSGYKSYGNIELGPYYNLLSFNAIEGTRLRFGGRTTNAFSKWHELSGYLAYGTKDEKFKYSAGFQSFITKKPRQMVGLYYKNDVEIPGKSQKAFTQDNILASVFRRTPLTSLTGVEQVQSYYEREWFSGFSTKLVYVGRKINPLGYFRYEYLKDDHTVALKENIKTSEIRFVTRLAYGEKYVSRKFLRTGMGTKYPVVQLQYALGIKNLFHSDYNYQKLSVNVKDRIRISPFGYIDYRLEYEKIWGTLPYPLLEIHEGNETYTYDPYAYNMMNYYEFVSDEYATVQAFHHFDGLFLNKVPLFRKLKWREVLSAKALIGKVNDKNRNILIFPSTLTDLHKGPYYEAGVGIENIFKIFRIDALWRLSYLDNPNISKFGIRGSIHISF